jgi:hypothetical protein
MEIPEKYKQFLNQGVKVVIKEQQKIVRFSFENNYALVKQFLLILEITDFLPYEVRLYIWGPCTECQQLYGSESVDETLKENIKRAKKMEKKGGDLYIHICPECSFKIWGKLGFDEKKCH